MRPRVVLGAVELRVPHKVDPDVNVTHFGKEKGLQAQGRAAFVEFTFRYPVRTFCVLWRVQTLTLTPNVI